MKKYCNWCLQGFETTTNNQKYCCNRCLKSAQRAEKERIKLRKQQCDQQINAFINELNRYNAEHGTNLSYGQYASMLRLQKLKWQAEKKKKKKEQAEKPIPKD